jgi:hypothetical protein
VIISNSATLLMRQLIRAQILYKNMTDQSFEEKHIRQEVCLGPGPLLNDGYYRVGSSSAPKEGVPTAFGGNGSGIHNFGRIRLISGRVILSVFDVSCRTLLLALC